MLNPNVPLVDFRIARRAGVQVAAVAETPLRHRPVLCPLRSRKPVGEWAIAVRIVGRVGINSQTRELGLVIILREVDIRRLLECGTGVLEVGRNVHSIEHSGSAPQHGVGCQLVSKTEAGSKIVAIHSRIAIGGCGKDGCPHNIPDSREPGCRQNGQTWRGW